MTCRLIGVMAILVLIVGNAFSFEVGGTIRKIDAENRTAFVFAGGQERTVNVATNAKILDENGQVLKDGLAAKELKEGATVTLTVEPVGNVPTIVSIQLGGRANSPARPNQPGSASVGKSSVGFKPLTEMTASDQYKGEDGGLYGGGRNELPESLRAAVALQTAKVTPLNAAGKPAADGKIGLVSISMSNATQEFSRFKQIADQDSQKSQRVAIVDCAQGGQTMERWADPNADCWTEADRRLDVAAVSLEQVQVAWVKLANGGPSGDLDTHGKRLQRDTEAVISNLKKHFPNLRLAYLGSRIYGGWAEGRLNPEPYAYEGAFVVRWMIKDQLNHNLDPTKTPLLLWGPYLWADGLTPRQSDGLVWQRSDMLEDGTHPSDNGRQKVATQLLKFFKTDDFTSTWFVTRSVR